MSGGQVGDVELNASVFGVEPNIHLMHQVVVAEEANGRQGTHDVKTRAEVSGGGAKPFRQKGTGRARQGTIRAPHMYHGGIVFGPTPRSYRQDTPKKMRRGALKSAISARITDGDVIIVDEIKLDKISTKLMTEFLKSVGASGKVLIAVTSITQEVSKSARNIPGVSLRLSPGFSTREILNSDKIIMTQAAVSALEEVLSK